MTKSNEVEDDFDALIYRSTPGAPSTRKQHRQNNIDNIENLQSKSSSLSHKSSSSSSLSPRTSPKSSSPSIVINKTPSYLSRSKGSTLSQKIPPKIVLKFFIHEEVSSTQEMRNNLDDITSHVNIEGAIHTQIISSDAVKNPPFALRLSDPDYPEDNYEFDTNFMTYYGSGEYNTLSIPKAVMGKVKVASYQRTVTKKFMPVLVQSKIIRSGPHLEKCLLAIQIRSNLKNKGSLKDMNVCCAVPPTVIGKTFKITTGEGTFDEFKRLIRWNVKELAVGSSVVFGAEVQISLKNISIDELPKFPVLIRCNSTDDIISSVEVDVKEINGHPATIVVMKNHSFRLLHRLPS